MNAPSTTYAAQQAATAHVEQLKREVAEAEAAVNGLTSHSSDAAVSAALNLVAARTLRLRLAREEQARAESANWQTSSELRDRQMTIERMVDDARTLRDEILQTDARIAAPAAHALKVQADGYGVQRFVEGERQHRARQIEDLRSVEEKLAAEGVSPLRVAELEARHAKASRRGEFDPNLEHQLKEERRLASVTY